jgi:hypothetical protein
MASRTSMSTGPVTPLITMPLPFWWIWVWLMLALSRLPPLRGPRPIPSLPKPDIVQCSMCTEAASLTLIPLRLRPPMPSRARPRRATTAFGALTTIPSPPAAATLPITPVQSIVTDLKIVNGPEVSESRHMMVPPGRVFARARANVWHGAAGVHGFASSPSPETKVVLWACAGVP